MHIAIVGPVATENINHLLSESFLPLPRGYGGAPLMATLIDCLLQRGHRISVFTTSIDVEVSRDNWISAGDDHFRIYYIGQRPHAFRPKFGFTGRAMDLFSVERDALVAAIKMAAPDVVHGHWAYEFGLAAVDSGLPCVVTCHDSPRNVLKFMPNAYRFVRYLMARKCFSKAKIVTAVSPYTRDSVQKYCKNRVEVVQNPLPDFLFEEAQRFTRHLMPKVGGRRIAMVINGWGGLKNPEPALKGFKILKSGGHKDLEMHLFGADFGPGEMAENWCHNYEIRDGLFFHGRIPHRELLFQLGKMDLVIHPALEESCPMGVAEAMSLGLPIIGGDKSGGVPWVIGDGGVTTDVTSPQAIAQAADKLLSNENFWQYCSSSALKRSQEVFTAQVVGDLYEEHYKRALAIAQRAQEMLSI